MARFWIGATFWGAVFIRGRRLLEGSAYFDLIVNVAAFIKGCLFEAQHLLEEMR